MIAYLPFCICISLVLQTGQALFLLESPRKAFGQMVAGQLETKEFETIIIIYPRQIKAKTTSVTIIVPILPPSARQPQKNGKFPRRVKVTWASKQFISLSAVSLFLGESMGKNAKNTAQVSSQECASRARLWISHKVAARNHSDSRSNLHTHCLWFSRKREAACSSASHASHSTKF